MRRYLFVGFLPALASLSAPLCAAEGTTGAAAPTVGAASGAAAQLAQLVLGLGLVIGLIFLLAWLVRRVQQAGPRGNRLIRTLASQPLGPRDRLALFLTMFVMAPVFDKINSQALQPYLNEQIPAQEALQKAEVPLKAFMLAQTRTSDLELFVRLSKRTDIGSPEATPLTILVPAFVTSELKTAFQIGFMIFIPFLIIDLVVSSVLMAMGMMMLSPLIISLPFKIMLFVLVDGWALIIGTLAGSFGTV